MHVLYDAWTKADELERWFLSKARFFDEANQPVPMNKNFEAAMRYEFSWFLYPTTEGGRITKANGKDHLQFTFAGDCLVDVHLSEQYGYTVVELSQTNIPIDDDSKQNIRLGCSSGWSFYFVNLKSVYEGGLDLRSKDESLRPMVNN